MDQIHDGEGYALGHSEQEIIRLERQGEIFGTQTREILGRAGLKNGMRVLDIGCGAGDVSLIAAEIVGPTGYVLGIDSAERALAPARMRAERVGFEWLEFAKADVDAFRSELPFDAVIGRFILMYVPDPAATLRRVAAHLQAGGIVAFIEMDIDQAGAIPEMPLLRTCIDWMAATYRKAGAEPNMGSKLYAAYRAAGLSPQLMGGCRIESGPDAIAYDFAAETLRSLLPAMQRHGIATAQDVQVETIAARLRETALAGDHCILMPRLIGAWATAA